jgi:hypothetical protein
VPSADHPGSSAGADRYSAVSGHAGESVRARSRRRHLGHRLRARGRRRVPALLPPVTGVVLAARGAFASWADSYRPDDRIKRGRVRKAGVGPSDVVGRRGAEPVEASQDEPLSEGPGHTSMASRRNARIHTSATTPASSWCASAGLTPSSSARSAAGIREMNPMICRRPSRSVPAGPSGRHWREPHRPAARAIGRPSRYRRPGRLGRARGRVPLRGQRPVDLDP